MSFLKLFKVSPLSTLPLMLFSTPSIVASSTLPTPNTSSRSRFLFDLCRVPGPLSACVPGSAIEVCLAVSFVLWRVALSSLPHESGSRFTFSPPNRFAISISCKVSILNRFWILSYSFFSRLRKSFYSASWRYSSPWEGSCSPWGPFFLPAAIAESLCKELDSMLPWY